jgi:hypothetical protein
MVQGEISYKNYWKGNVFAPFAMLVGVLSLYIVLFKSEIFDKKSGRNNQKPRKKYPWEDFRKW